MSGTDLRAFVRESNRIEGITRVREVEVEATRLFLGLSAPTVEDMVTLVKVYQPDAVLRDREGLNVRVGRHLPPAGGPLLRLELGALLECVCFNTPYENHLRYETLHPFTDGNGRSGRALWLWQVERMGGTSIGFLHAWYYQSLQGSRP